MPVTHVDDRFHVLFVCTANLCRSPMAQFLLIDRLQSIGPSRADQWQVHSAGTQASDGSMHPSAEQVLADRHITPSPFARTSLRPELVAEADLVLTAGAAHRSAAIRMSPKASGYTFTIKQFGRLCADIPTGPAGMAPADAGRWLLEQARSRRGHQGVVDARTEELADPLGAGMRAFRRCADTIDDSVTSILAPIASSA